MDTKEKNRDGVRQRKAGQDQRRQRPAQEERPRKGAQPARTERQARQPEPPRQSRRQPEQPRQARQQPEQAQPARTERQAKQADQPRQSRQQAQQRRRPAQQAQQEAPQRQSRKAHIPYSAPKGTGFRKSAPQMSEEETAALRRRQPIRQEREPEPEKKNALQNFISGVRSQAAPTDAAAKSEKRRADRTERAEKQRKQAQRYDTPAVIYTQPMAFSRDKLLIQLLTVTAVVAAFVIGMSVFFKVGIIEVAGATTYDAATVVEASGITAGDGLLTFSKPKAAAQIQAALAYVDDVRIGIKLPDKVIIYVEEAAVTYAVESTQGDWWLISAEGKVVQQLDRGQYSNYTQVLGVRLEAPEVGNPAMAADAVPEETLASGELLPVKVTGAQQLSAALQILKALEANDIVGSAASVDVTALDDVRLWWEKNRYEVLLGDTTRMEYKIACMKDVIYQMSDYQAGILDISFTHWADQVGYTPFG